MDDDLSISSVESMEEEKELVVRDAMLMVFFSKKKMEDVGEEATKKTKARFAINLDEGKAMRTKKII